MAQEHVIVRVTVGIIVLVTVVSGPIVGAVDFTHQAESSPGDGTVELSVLSIPTNNARFEPGRYGSTGHILRVPDAVVSVDAIRGEPVIIYKIRIPGLSYVRLSIHLPNEKHRGDRYRLSLEPDNFASERLTRETYDAELLIVVRERNTAQTIAKTNISVEVK